MVIMKKIVLGILLTLMTAGAGEITIAAAANVSYAMEALIKEFNVMHPQTRVEVTLGSSGKLTAQIRHGAPYDLLLSADMKYPEALYSEKIAVTKPVLYAQGALAFLSQKELDYKAGMKLLESKEIRKIALANPQTAPYGVAAVEAMKHANVYDAVKEKFVYGESISQTVAYATTAADIGIIAKSSLFSPQMSHYKENKQWSEVNSTLYTPIDQGMVILKKGENDAEVKAFYDFILSNKGKEILIKYGYKVE